ncbi:Protein phosphatase methylesterase 1 [Penicillium subrubescens]|uniref:Protein phosphatase methylesterase 1 n=1 Tax=Penicillium subrubescens TaxID=1316194 RepID=A0A1Q5T871_9EURO|nr:Protein phosphatase methylesterase 1 [Penicillium subrubescens]
MSDLQKSFAKAKLGKLPSEAPMYHSVNIPEEHHDEDGSSASSVSSTGTLMPSPTRNLFARRGGGQTTQSLSWTDFFSQELFLPEEINGIQIIHHVYLTPPSESGPLFVMHHGAGSSGLSFATCADELRKLLPKAGVLSIDARSHGRTAMTPKSKPFKQDNPSTGLAAQAEADAKIELDLSLDTLSRDLVFVIRETQAKMGWENLPDMVLVGHSLGGAVITDVAKKGELGSKLLAYAVLDVVEARVSVPSLIYEETEPTDPSRPWVWRTNLSATKPFWENWFIGLSRKFLDARGGKLLLLAGTDRLDKELMIGQMQGKYQLQVFPEAGHFIQEDQPSKTAQVLADFYRRNDRSALVLPPKVGDLQAAAAMKKGAGVFEK